MMILAHQRRFVAGTLPVQLAHLQQHLAMLNGASVMNPAKVTLAGRRAITQEQRTRILARSERKYLTGSERLSRELGIPEQTIKHVRAAYELEAARARRV